MSEQTQQTQGKAPVATVPATDMALLQQMVAILLEEKAEASAEKKEKRRIHEARVKSRENLSQYNLEQKIKAQSICTHLKGGKPSADNPRSAKIDYAVGHHTFPDHTSAIRCHICGMLWKRKDTVDFLQRGGKQVVNHTGIGWLEAVKMLRESTNTPTASETNVTQSISRPQVDPDFVVAS